MRIELRQEFFNQMARLFFSRSPAMIRDEDGAITGYVYLDLQTKDYGGFVSQANKVLPEKLVLPPGYTYRWAGEYEFELRAKERLKIIFLVVFFVIFVLPYMVFKSATEAAVLIFPAFYAMSGGLLLQWVTGSSWWSISTKHSSTAWLLVRHEPRST